ncbi:hypothetical protein Tco_1555024 [Tanacetum coccineum]
MAAFLEKSIGSEGFHQVIDFLSQSHISYALTKKPEIYISFIKQFWRTAEASTNTDREVTITAIIDGQSKTITEASLRRHLKLEDHDGITSIPNSEIFEQLALMGYQADSDKLTFQKGVFSPQWSAAFTKLILRIKKLESKVKTRKAKKRARVMLSKDEEDDSSKQGRKISDIDEDLNTYFAQEDEVVHDQDTTKGG